MLSYNTFYNLSVGVLFPPWKVFQQFFFFPTILNIYKKSQYLILHNKLTIYKYYWFFYLVCHYVRRKWKEKLDILIDFNVLRRIGVYTKVCKNSYFFHTGLLLRWEKVSSKVDKNFFGLGPWPFICISKS